MPARRLPRPALPILLFAVLLAGTASGDLAAALPRGGAPHERPEGGAAAPAGADTGRLGTYRFPTIHGDTIVFVAEGDLWSVGVQGGLARRLTTHLAEESHPRISPDGSTLAFTGAYEGPREVYTMPLDGGLPTRLTWEGGDAEVVGWTPDGRVLYATQAYSTLPNWQLATIDPRTREHTLVPLAQAADGDFAEDGTLFFTRLHFQGSHTKRYRGGTAQSIWRLDPGASEAVPLTADFPGTSKNPMLWQGRVLYASDRDGTMNLWSMATDGSDLRQLTHHEFWQVRDPSLEGGRVVYQLGADIHLYEVASGRDRVVPVRIASDFDQMRERWIDEPAEWVSSAHLSPDGDRLALVARGEVFVMPVRAGQGRRVRVTRRPDVRYRSARFLDADRLVVLSDESGEVELWSLPADGIGPGAQLTDDARVLRWDALPSPDGRRVAHDNKDQELYVLELASGGNALVERNEASGIGSYTWSADGRWLAYEATASNEMTRIWLYDVQTGTRTPVTSERFNSYSPAWDPEGDFLYFLSDRNLTTLVPSPWGQRQPEPFVDRPSRIYELALRDGLRSPFQADDELADSPTPDEGRQPAAAAGGAKEAGDGAGGQGRPEERAAAPAVRIELVGLAGRLREVPVEPGDYSSLSTDGKRLYWLERELSPRRPRSLRALEISKERPRVRTLVRDVRAYELSADLHRLLVRKGNELYVFAAATQEPDLESARVDLSGWRFSLDPVEEWRQMFVEAWRLERDYFYDPGLHGVDWQGMLARYMPLVNRVRDRSELADVIAQMVSELSALHIFVRGGDQRRGSEQIAPAALGARLRRDEDAGGYRIEHIYRGDPDLPGELSPLARPGVGVREGDLIVALDGVPLTTAPDIGALLRGKADEQVRLSLARGDGETFDAIVVPISQARAADLRYDEWELTRRELVERLGGGRIGYLHLRAMGGRNWQEFARNYYPVFRREGLIVDVRHNRGGNIDSWILEKLMRKAWFFWAPRVGQPYWNMQYAFRGHMVALVNERTASDGEAFAEGFRRLGLGPLIGTRTWGGEIWLTSSNFLVDRGIATAAEFGVYGPVGEWLIEGWGVEPDIVVDNLPHETFAGRDRQLEEAVRTLLDKLEREPVPQPQIPPRPDKSFRDNRRRSSPDDR